jgi:hypothetical protein
MASIKVANFAFIKPEGFTLPGLITSGTHAHIWDHEDIKFDLPNDARERGMLSFYWDTGKGADDKIDVAFEVSVNAGATKYSYSFNADRTGCFQLPVSGLKHGANSIRFTTTKAGTVTAPDPDENLLGKGVVHFGQVCLTYHRDVAL